MAHTKRSQAFFGDMCMLAQKLLGVHDKGDLKRAAELLTTRTTDSVCMIKAKDIEPVFVLRAKDPVAKFALVEWIKRAEQYRLHGDKLQDAREALKEFEGYQP